MQLSVLLNHLDFQVIEVDFLHKRILAGACFGMAAEIVDIAVEPDWFAEGRTACRPPAATSKNLMGSGFFAVVAD